MTEQEKRIAIAEACDHYFVQALDNPKAWGFREAAKTTVYPWRDSKEEAALMDAPDYLHDLNAMHAALMSQSKDFRSAFAMIMDSKFDRYELEAKELADIFIEVLNERRQPAN